MRKVECFEIGEIGKGNSAFGRTADDSIRTVIFTLNPDAFGQGSMHHEPIELGFNRTCAANFLSHFPDKTRKTSTGNGRNREIEFEAVFGDEGDQRDPAVGTRTGSGLGQWRWPGQPER